MRSTATAAGIVTFNPQIARPHVDPSLVSSDPNRTVVVDNSSSKNEQFLGVPLHLAKITLRPSPHDLRKPKSLHQVNAWSSGAAAWLALSGLNTAVAINPINLLQEPVQSPLAIIASIYVELSEARFLIQHETLPKIKYRISCWTNRGGDARRFAGRCEATYVDFLGSDEPKRVRKRGYHIKGTATAAKVPEVANFTWNSAFTACPNPPFRNRHLVRDMYIHPRKRQDSHTEIETQKCGFAGAHIIPSRKMIVVAPFEVDRVHGMSAHMGGTSRGPVSGESHF